MQLCFSLPVCMRRSWSAHKHLYMLADICVSACQQYKTQLHAMCCYVACVCLLCADNVCTFLSTCCGCICCCWLPAWCCASRSPPDPHLACCSYSFAIMSESRCSHTCCSAAALLCCSPALHCRRVYCSHTCRIAALLCHAVAEAQCNAVIACAYSRQLQTYLPADSCQAHCCLIALHYRSGPALSAVFSRAVHVPYAVAAQHATTLAHVLDMPPHLLLLLLCLIVTSFSLPNLVLLQCGRSSPAARPTRAYTMALSWSAWSSKSSARPSRTTCRRSTAC